MKTIHDLHPDLFVNALELLPKCEYSCCAIDWAVSPISDNRDPAPRQIYNDLFKPDIDGYRIAWLYGSSVPEHARPGWRETALCFMIAITSDPWEVS